MTTLADEMRLLAASSFDVVKGRALRVIREAARNGQRIASFDYDVRLSMYLQQEGFVVEQSPGEGKYLEVSW